MATHGTTYDLGDGVVRYFVNIPDISSESSLLAAAGAGLKRKIINGFLSFDVASEVDIKKASGTVIGFLGQPSTARLGSSDQLKSDAAAALNIVGSVASKCQGYLDVVEGADPR